MIQENKKYTQADFITIVAESYRDSFATEQCEVLILVCITYILFFYLYISQPITIQISKDCQLVIDLLLF